MKKRNLMNRGIATLLSATMALSLMVGIESTVVGNKMQVQAATVAPSVTAYATRTQLMDDTFAPGSNGRAVNTGKLVFGKNSDGNAQEWFVLGKDDGVDGDNTIIFAASPIMTGMYNSVIEDKQYQEGYGTYADGNPTVLNANHYGASELRATLQNMANAEKSAYFSATERSLMKATTITTDDTKNSKSYTTSDKLYIPAGDLLEYSVKVGSSDKIASRIPYANFSELRAIFWLRVPQIEYMGGVYYIDSSFLVMSGAIINEEHAVRPASNLDLSNVLFASAATAASSDAVVSGTIAEGTAMTLRLNGSDPAINDQIGRATYDATTGEIRAVKGSISGNVALVVQGNDGTNDWYYSKQVGLNPSIVTVTGNDIKNQLGLSSDIDLSNCKIWMETTVDNVVYAVEATDKDKLVSITAPNSITVANGTAYDAMNLPSEVKIVTEGHTITSAPVTWDTTTPASGSYDPTLSTEQAVTLNGTVTCPNSVDANGVALTTTITITIRAAGAIPTTPGTTTPAQPKPENPTPEQPKPEEPKPEEPQKPDKPQETQKPKVEVLPAKASVTDNGQVTLTWDKVDGAEGYRIYRKVKGSKDGYQRVATTRNLQLVQKQLDNKKTYQYYIVAYKTIDGKKARIGKTLTLYAVMNNVKYTEVKKIKLNKKSYSLEVGAKAKIKAVLLKRENKKKIKAESEKLRFCSTDNTVAGVNASGTITAKGAGTCYIYVVAGNGISQKIKVTVSKEK